MDHLRKIESLKVEKSASVYQSKLHDFWHTAKKPLQCSYCGKTIPKSDRYFWGTPMDSKRLGKFSLSSLCPPGHYCHEYHLWKARRLVPEVALEYKYREALLSLKKKYGSVSLGGNIEFGVYNGMPMACMFRAMKALEIEHIRLFGFDSFKSLPDTAKTDDGGNWRPAPAWEE